MPPQRHERPSKPLYLTTEQTNINCATIIFKQLDDATEIHHRRGCRRICGLRIGDPLGRTRSRVARARDHPRPRRHADGGQLAAGSDARQHHPVAARPGRRNRRLRTTNPQRRKRTARKHRRGSPQRQRGTSTDRCRKTDADDRCGEPRTRRVPPTYARVGQCRAHPPFALSRLGSS